MIHVQTVMAFPVRQNASLWDRTVWAQSMQLCVLIQNAMGNREMVKREAETIKLNT